MYIFHEPKVAEEHAQATQPLLTKNERLKKKERDFYHLPMVINEYK